MYIAGSLAVFWEPPLHASCGRLYCLSKSRYHLNRWLQRRPRHQKKYHSWNARRPTGHLTGQIASQAIRTNCSKCGKLFSTRPPWQYTLDGKHSSDLSLSIFVPFWGHLRGHSREESGIDPYRSFGSDCSYHKWPLTDLWLMIWIFEKLKKVKLDK